MVFLAHHPQLAPLMIVVCHSAAPPSIFVRILFPDVSHDQTKNMYTLAETASLPSVFYQALGKETLCQVPDRKHSAKLLIPIVIGVSKLVIEVDIT